ncbi:MAG TPA: MFS transporter [Allosphingosinicella sp.]|jgi:MFS family permease
MDGAADAAVSGRLGRMRIVLVAGLGLAIGALDGSVMASAMPKVLEELNGVDAFAWTSASYIFMSVVCGPIWGSIGDQIGHRVTLRIGFVVLILGSILCAGAGLRPIGAEPALGMVELAVYRAIQGAGSAALFVSSFALLAENLSESERARYTGSFSVIYAICTILGPAAGGLLADLEPVQAGPFVISGWRWIFLVQVLPLFACWSLIGRAPHDRQRFDWHGLDYRGIALLALGLLLLMAGAQGTQDIWNGMLRVGVFVASAISFALFLANERVAARPIVPATFFTSRVMLFSALAGMFASAALLGLVVVLPIFLQGELGRTAAASGVYLAVFSVGVAIGAVGSGRFVARTGRYRTAVIAGIFIVICGGIGLILAAGMGPWMDKAALCLIGVGFGPLQGTYGLIAQRSCGSRAHGAAGGIVQLCRRIGATLGAFLAGLVITAEGPQLAGLADSPATSALLLRCSALCAVLLGAALALSCFLPNRLGAAEEERTT